MTAKFRSTLILALLAVISLTACQSMPGAEKNHPRVAMPDYYQGRLETAGLDTDGIACNSDNWWLETLKDESKLSADLLHKKLKSQHLLSEDRSPAEVHDVLNEHMMSWIVRTGLILRGGHNFGAIVLNGHYWQDESGRRQPLVIFRSAYTAYPERDGSCFGSLLENAKVKHVVNIYGDDFIYVQDLDQAERHVAESAGATYALTDKMGYGPWRHKIAEHPLPGAERTRAMNDVARLINEQILHPGGDLPRGNILIHCGGGMHRTGMIIGILQKVINGMPMEAIAAEYRYHVSYKNEDDPGGFEQGNLDFIRDFDPRLIAK
jgi:hypothetical protein